MALGGEILHNIRFHDPESRSLCFLEESWLCITQALIIPTNLAECSLSGSLAICGGIFHLQVIQYCTGSSGYGASVQEVTVLL